MALETGSRHFPGILEQGDEEIGEMMSAPLYSSSSTHVAMLRISTHGSEKEENRKSAVLGASSSPSLPVNDSAVSFSMSAPARVTTQDDSGASVTGMPLRTALPESGSRAFSSRSAFRFAPGRSR